MSELIDRQAAIDAISKKQGGVFDQDAEIDTAVLYVYSECKAIIKDLPSVHPELSNNSPKLDIKNGELISRQAAIDLVESFYKIDKSVLKIMVFKLKQLPSVQPETNCSEIPNNSDLISRQAAIDALDKRFDSVPMEQTTEILMLRKGLRELPSSQPRNKGEWIDYSDEGYVECPFCHSATNCDGNKDELHYCFSCGAELR